MAADVLDPTGLAWSYRTPGAILTGSPVVADGIAYVGTRDENGLRNNAVHAVDVRTGKRLWQTGPSRPCTGRPPLADGLGFVPTIHGSLFAFDAKTGELRWKRIPNRPRANNQRSYSYYSPAVADGNVYWPYQTGSARPAAACSRPSTRGPAPRSGSRR